MNILDEVKGASRIAIGGHIRPDGDCAGACLGLYLYLKKMMPKAQISVYLNPLPASLQCMPGCADIKTAVTDEDMADIFVMLDCSADRLDFSKPLFDKACKRINIDHHKTNNGTDAEVNYIKPEASSASELVYEVIDPAYLDADIAQNIYLGIVHDTGVFRYSCTKPSTMAIAGELMKYGFDAPGLIESTFYVKTYAQNQIMARALLESVRFMDGRCIVAKVDRRMMDFYGVKTSDLDGIVSALRNTEGVDCAIFMYELDHMLYKVSLRTSEAVDAALITKVYNGGGHARAAGCTMNGTFHDNVNNLSALIEEQLFADK